MGKIVNTPFYRYSGHIEFIRFNEYYGMPRGYEHDQIYSHQYLRALFGPIFLYVFLEKDYNGKKKDRCAVFGRNNDCLFLEKYTVRFSFFPKCARK